MHTPAHTRIIDTIYTHIPHEETKKISPHKHTLFSYKIWPIIRSPLHKGMCTHRGTNARQSLYTTQNIQTRLECMHTYVHTHNHTYIEVKILADQIYILSHRHTILTYLYVSQLDE